MKKTFVFLGICILLSGCTEKNDEVLNLETSETTFAEEKPDGISAELIPFDFKETPKEADLVAEIVIGEKLEEVEEIPIPYTLFEAEIKEVIQGTPVSETIVIKQQGDSEWIFNDNDLFEVGEEYILFLKENTVSKGDYWILGEETGMFQVSEDEEVVKLADPLEEFEDIEIGPKGSELQQVLDKDSFVEKIKLEEQEN